MFKKSFDMKKIFLPLAVCLLGGFSVQAQTAVTENWVNRTVVINPQIDATTVHNYGIIYLVPPVGYPYLFDNVQYFYNEYSGLINVVAPGLRLNHHDASGDWNQQTGPMELYWNEGEIRGYGRSMSSGLYPPLEVPSFRFLARNVVDSGQIHTYDSLAAIDVEATENLDLWGANYSALGGASGGFINENAHLDNPNIRAGGIWPYAWGHGVQEGRNVQYLGPLGAGIVGISASGSTPTGGMSITPTLRTVSDGAGNSIWWADANPKVYINTASYDPGDPKPFYQVVFVPGDHIDYQFDDLGNVVGCNSYNQFRVDFAGYGAYRDMSGVHSASPVLVTQYLYKESDAQEGLGKPRYQQIYWEDLTGYFYTEMADNQLIPDEDGLGYTPDRFWVDVSDSPVPYMFFEFDPVTHAPRGMLALPSRYIWRDVETHDIIPMDPDTGEPLPVGDQVPYRAPAWTQELMPFQGPFQVEVGFSCLNGSLTQREDDLKWLRPGDLPYRIDPENPGNARVDIDYSAYQISIGTNAFDKVTLLQNGYPVVSELDSSKYPGHITITGGTGESILDNFSADAQQTVTLNITNLTSAENVKLNANYVNAFFSRLKDPSDPNRKLVLKEVVSPTMTRLQGNMAIYSGIYTVTFQISDTPYVRNPQDEEVDPDPVDPDPDDPEDPDAEEPEEEEPEWEDADFLFHLVFVGPGNDPAALFTVPTDFIDTMPRVDRFHVETELPAEVTEIVELGEDFSFKTPELTLNGNFTFPTTVTDEKFINIQNFTNYAVLRTQENIRLSGSYTNEFIELPAIDLLLGVNREPTYENFIHRGILQFNRIELLTDYLELSEGGSTASHQSSVLRAPTMHFYDGLARAGGDLELHAQEMNLWEAGIEAGNEVLSAHVALAVGTGAGTITLNVTDRLDDGFDGYTDPSGNKINVAKNKLYARGSIKIPVKPAEGNLLNTELEINSVRVSRNIWAGEDLGDTPEGWSNNMALDRLTLSGLATESNGIRFDFEPPTGSANGALYVRDLYLGVRPSLASVTLDYGKMIRCNGVNIYYVNCYLREVISYRDGTYRWVLLDSFPGVNSGIIQTRNHPVFTDLVAEGTRPTTDEMNFDIQTAEPDSLQVAGGDFIFGNVELTWDALAGITYEIEVAEALEGPWSSFYAVSPTVDGKIILPLSSADSQRFFRLKKSDL